MNNRFPTVRAVATIALVALAGLVPAQAESLDKIKVGHLVALDMAPLFVAKESGCFRDQGLDVETVFFSNPGDNNAALAGSAIDFSINPFTLPFFAANSGVPIRVIAAAGGWGVMEVIAQPELDMADFDDMKAYVESDARPLRIATLQGDTLEMILRSEFEKHDIDESQVRFIYFNDLLAMVEAFRNGQADVLSHIKPYTTQLVEQRGATVLTTNAETWGDKAPNTVVSTLQKTLDNKPKLVERYLKGMQCGAALINDTPDKAVELLVDGGYFRVEPDVLAAAFKSAPAPITFTPDVEAVQTVVDDMSALGYISDETSTDDIFRLDTIKQLEQ